MSYYEILNVGQDAKDEEIKKAFKQKALKYHPDRAVYDTSEAREKFRELDEAYKVLSNEDRRALYDVYHRHKSLFEDYAEKYAQMQSQLKQMFVEAEQQYQKTTVLDDSILDQIPLINLDMLIKIYNTRHQKKNYYNYYKELSHKIMTDIESSIQRECSRPTKEVSSISPYQQQRHRMNPSYINNGRKQLKANNQISMRNDNQFGDATHPTMKYGSESSDSNTDSLFQNMKGNYDNDESSTSMNQQGIKYPFPNNSTLKAIEYPSQPEQQSISSRDYLIQQNIEPNQISQNNTNKTQEQIEDDLMNEDDDGEELFDQNEMGQYPNDIDGIDDEENCNNQYDKTRQLNLDYNQYLQNHQNRNDYYQSNNYHSSNNNNNYNQYYEHNNNSEDDEKEQQKKNNEKLQSLLKNPIEYFIRNQQNQGRQFSPQLQNFQQKYMNLINNYEDHGSKNRNTHQTNSAKRISQHEMPQSDQDILNLYRNRVYSSESDSNQNHVDNKKPIQNMIAYTGAHSSQQDNYNRQQPQIQSQQQQQKLTKKQIKTLWQQTQQKKVMKRISKKQPVFKLIKKEDIKRSPIKWQQIQEKIQLLQEQLKQYSQFIMKYKNKKNQPSIMEISKQKYLELVERKKLLCEEQNNIGKSQEDELEDYDATLDKNELACYQYCQLNNVHDAFNQVNHKNQERRFENNQISQYQKELAEDNQFNHNNWMGEENNNIQQVNDEESNYDYNLNEQQLLDRVNDYNNEKYLNEEERHNLVENNFDCAINTSQVNNPDMFDYLDHNRDESEQINYSDSQGYSSLEQEQNMQNYMDENKEDAALVKQLILDQQNKQQDHTNQLGQQGQVQVYKNNLNGLNNTQYDYNNLPQHLSSQQITSNIPANDSNIIKQISQDNATLSYVNNPTHSENNLENNGEFNYNPSRNELEGFEDENYNNYTPSHQQYLDQDQSSFNPGNEIFTPTKNIYFPSQQTPYSKLQKTFSMENNYPIVPDPPNIPFLQAQHENENENQYQEQSQDQNYYSFLDDNMNNHYQNQSSFNYEQNI